MDERKGFTPEEMKAKIAAAEEELPALEASLRRAAVAAREDSFSGALRRAVQANKRHLPAVAREAGLNRAELSGFLDGTSTLTTAQVDALVKTLSLESLVLVNQP
jgi:DNA-binding phage protein